MISEVFQERLGDLNFLEFLESIRQKSLKLSDIRKFLSGLTANSKRENLTSVGNSIFYDVPSSQKNVDLVKVRAVFDTIKEMVENTANLNTKNYVINIAYEMLLVLEDESIAVKNVRIFSAKFFSLKLVNYSWIYYCQHKIIPNYNNLCNFEY